MMMYLKVMKCGTVFFLCYCRTHGLAYLNWTNFSTVESKMKVSRYPGYSEAQYSQNVQLLPKPSKFPTIIKLTEQVQVLHCLKLLHRA